MEALMRKRTNALELLDATDRGGAKIGVR